MQTIIKVNGMTCSHCAMMIKAELSEIQGVNDCKVNVEQKSVEIDHEEKLDLNKVNQAIESLGYEIVR